MFGLLVFFALPLVALVVRVPWSDITDDLSDPAIRPALRLSLVCSVAATGLSVVIGVPIAWLLARVEFPGKAVARALALLPLVLPPVVGGVALLVVGLSAMAFATVWPVLIVACAVLALGQGVASPSISALVSEIAPPARRGEAMGYQQSSYAVGRIVGPPAAGWMFDHAGVWSPYAGAAGLCAIALVLLLKWGVHRGPQVTQVTVSSV